MEFDAALLKHLTPQERSELDALILSDRTIWRPDPKNGPQCQAYESTADIIGFGGSAGGGKGLDLDTPLPTPTGWTTMGAVQAGDWLLDQSGKPCQVSAVSSISNRDCYRLTFDDGSVIVADDVHRWVTRLSGLESISIRSTSEIYSTLRTVSGRPNHSIQIGPIEYRYIVDCLPVDSVPTKCIAVDSPSRQYLAGRTMIPTHNTDLGCGLTVNKHRRVGVFRDNGTELTAIVDRFAELFKSRDGFNGKDNIWRTRRADGKSLQIDFGSFPNPRDETKYQGRPHDLIILEEAANMRRDAALFVMGWLRTTVPGQMCQVLMTFNPPTTVEGRWIVEYFAPWLDRKFPTPAKGGELRWATSLPATPDNPNGKELWVDGPEPFVVVEGKPVYDFDPASYSPEEIIKPRSRTFIPSRVSNNSYLKDTGYMATLQSLPEPLRSQMLNGDFSAGVKDDPWQVIPTAWVEAAMERWRKKDAPGEMVSLGADIAQGGADNTVISQRYVDLWFDDLIVYKGKDCPDGPTNAGHIVAATRNGSPQHIDLFGVGAKPYGHLMEMRQDVIGIDMGASTWEMDENHTMNIFNLRSMLWWRMREALDPNKKNGIALPQDNKLLQELCCATWEAVTHRGKTAIKVCGRDKIIDKIGRSADRATAVILANIDSPKSDLYTGLRDRKRFDYDPMSLV